MGGSQTMYSTPYRTSADKLDDISSGNSNIKTYKQDHKMLEVKFSFTNNKTIIKTYSPEPKLWHRKNADGICMTDSEPGVYESDSQLDNFLEHGYRKGFLEFDSCFIPWHRFLECEIVKRVITSVEFQWQDIGGD